jgi:hypothetical protein
MGRQARKKMKAQTHDPERKWRPCRRQPSTQDRVMERLSVLNTFEENGRISLEALGFR